MAETRPVSTVAHVKPLPSLWKFARRLGGSIAGAGVLIGVSLLAGMWGYHSFEGMPWIDAFVNASMILGGMGPVDQLHTDNGKIFAGCYALYSGLTVIIAMGIILSPVLHRVMHRFHLEAGRSD